MEVARHWRLKKQRYNLDNRPANPVLDEEYPSTETTLAANGNGSVVTLQIEQAKTSTAITPQGTIYSYTVVANAPAGFIEQAPYVLALVELDDGTMLTAQLTDLQEEPQIGERVEMVTRKLRTDGEAGMIVYGYKFRPLLRS